MIQLESIINKLTMNLVSLKRRFELPNTIREIYSTTALGKRYLSSTAKINDKGEGE